MPLGDFDNENEKESIEESDGGDRGSAGRPATRTIAVVVIAALAISCLIWTVSSCSLVPTGVETESGSKALAADIEQDVSTDEVAEKGEEASDAVKDESTQATKPSTGGNNGGSGSNSGDNGGGSTSKRSGGTGGNPGGSSSKPSDGSSSGGGSDSQPSKPAHTHDCQPVTEQRWVVDQAAWDEQVKVGSQIVCSCGATFSSNEAWSDHAEAEALQGSMHSYSVEPVYETVHHDEVGHYETAIIGYKCSGCGATK